VTIITMTETGSKNNVSPPSTSRPRC
jgi:hypothetical protein